jgi:hypothetical protein
MNEKSVSIAAAWLPLRIQGGAPPRPSSWLRFCLAILLASAACESEDVGNPILEVSSAWDWEPSETRADGPGDLRNVDGSAVPCTPDQACDDEDPCTHSDQCSSKGECAGTPYSCDDGLACTQDVCLGDGGCKIAPRNGFCLIDGECHVDGDSPQDNPCLECITATATEAWSPDDSNACDDGSGCTVGDSCHDGQCLGKLLCPPTGNPCQVSQCKEGECFVADQEGQCDDNDVCTTSACQDGACTVTATLECDDGNLCTDDGCHPLKGCTHVANGSPCDDGNPCTLNEGCAEGICQAGADLLACDDGDPCTDDSCHPTDGCQHFPNTAPCDDGDPCLLGDSCFAGICNAGSEPAACDDANVCTADQCQPFVGCGHAPANGPCDDGNPCQYDDFCAGGLCQAGLSLLDCADSNVCTEDSCDPEAGCLHPAFYGPCDDGNLCTIDDTCGEDGCVGKAPLPCDDGNVCTKDACDPEAGCTHALLKTAECRPKITIAFPPRGATLTGDPTVTVTGTVTSKAGAITEFNINGAAVALDPDGSFAHPLESSQGMNLIIAETLDELGGTARTTPAYYFSTVWYPVDAADPKKAMVQDGLMVFLGPEVWDDNDTSDVDDLATVMVYYMASLDLGALIKNPVSTGKYLWCDYVVNVSNIQYGDPDIDLIPIDGGLHQKVVIPDFSADIQIDSSGFLCSLADMKGKATATDIEIVADVLIASNGGVVSATMSQSNVTVHGLNIQISGGWGFLLNWLIDFFEDSFAAQLEDAFEKQLGAQIPKAIVDALNSLALDQSIPVAPFMDDGEAVVLKIKTGLSSAKFTPQGAALGMQATVVVPKVTPHNPLGSIGRAACLTGLAEPFTFPMKGQLELALHDDFFNQIPYGMYLGGLLEMDLTSEQLGVDLSQYGLDNVDLHVDFLLPPIMTSCTPDSATVLQIGDMRVDGQMNLYGLPVEMTVYASMETEAGLVPVTKDDGTKELSIALGDVRIMEVEVAAVTGPLEGAEEVLVSLIENQLMGGFLDNFSGGAMGAFPIPDVDLSGVNPAVPADAKISLDLKEVLRVLGYWVLTGDVKQ